MIGHFHKKANFLFNNNNIWFLQNLDLIIQLLNNINKKKRAKDMSTYDFSTLWTKLTSC